MMHQQRLSEYQGYFSIGSYHVKIVKVVFAILFKKCEDFGHL